MHAFATLSPSRRARRPAARRGTTARRRDRLRRLRVEPLERRELLAVDVVRTSDTRRFAIDIQSGDTHYGEYHSFQVTNTDGVAYPDVWVRITGIPVGQKVQLAPQEDGLFYLGNLPTGTANAKTAFIYFTAEEFTVPARSPDPQVFTVEVRSGDPVSGTLLASNSTSGWEYVAEAIEDDSSSVTQSVTMAYEFAGLATAGPVVGGTMTMVVTGNVKNKADRVLFSPASTLEWPANAFELVATQVDYDPPPSLPPDFIFERPVLDAPKDFTATYTFAVTATTSGPTPVTPIQFCAHGDKSRNFDHSRLLGGVVPIPTATDVVSLTKVSFREGVPVDTYIAGEPLTYEITLANAVNVAVNGVKVNDLFPAALEGVQWYATYLGGATGDIPGPGTPATGDIVNRTVNLPVGGSVVITVTATVALGTTGVLQNTVTAVLPDETEITATDIDYPDVVLAITKTSSSPVGPGVYVQGGALDYVITITNSDSLDAEGVVISDLLPPELDPLTTTWYAVLSGGATSGDLPQDPLNPATGNISGTADIPDDGVVTIYVDGFVLPTARSTITNTVTAGVPLGRTFSATVEDNPDVTLVLTKSSTSPVGPNRYVPGGSLTYTITVTNTGLADAIAFAVDDVLPDQLDVQAGEISWSSPNPDDDADLELLDGVIGGTLTVVAGSTLTITIATTVPLTATGQLLNRFEAFLPWGVDYSVEDRDDPPVPVPGEPLVVVGTDDGCKFPPAVYFLDVEGTLLPGLTLTWQNGLFEKKFRGGVRVTTGDVTGDGLADVVVGSGKARTGEIRVFVASGVGPATTYTYDDSYTTVPFGTSYRAGVEVAVGDVDGDGVNDIIAARSSGAPTVRAFLVDDDPMATDPVADDPTFSFRAFAAPYANGVMLAAADFDGDGVVEIVTGSNAGLRATVRVWDVAVTPTVVRTILPIGPTFKGGVTVWTGRYASGLSPNDGVPDIFVAAGVGGNSVTEVYDGVTGTRLLRTEAFTTFARKNARLHVAGADITGSGAVTDLYAVRGLNGAGGPAGVRRLQFPTTTSWLSQSPTLRPPLRIATVLPRVLPPAMMDARLPVLLSKP